MKWFYLCVYAVIAGGITFIQIAFLNLLSLPVLGALFVAVLAITLLLIPLVRRCQMTYRSAAVGTLAACLVGWFVLLPLTSLLLVAPFPQRWGIIGTWTSSEQEPTPTTYQRTFSPFGTFNVYAEGQIRTTGQYLFLDDHTVQIRWHRVPRQFTVAAQTNVYNVQLTDDTLTLTDTRFNRTDIYHR